MGLYPQPNHWACGPFALKHALITLGILVDERQIARISGTHWWAGTDEVQLAKAARKHGVDLELIRKHDEGRARRELVDYLRAGYPVLLCVREWEHWVAAVKEDRGTFIILDSLRPEVLSIYSWPQLRNLWVYHEEDEYDEDTVHTLFDLHPAIPRRGAAKMLGKFTVARARYLRRKSNRDLAQLWDVYLDDLLAISRPRSVHAEKVFSLGEFLRRHEVMILDQIELWHGGINRGEAKKILDNMHFVADTYGLVIHNEDEKRAIAAVSMILGMWAAERYGVEPIYRSNRRKT